MLPLHSRMTRVALRAIDSYAEQGQAVITRMLAWADEIEGR
jgi:hypothetical protein